MKKARIPMMIFIAVLLPVETGAAGAGGITAPACAPGWMAPHLLQNLAPSASGFPQLTQNVAIYGPSITGRMLRSQRVPVKSIREAVSCFWFPVSSKRVQTHRQVSEFWCLVSCSSLSTNLAESNPRRQEWDAHIET